MSEEQENAAPADPAITVELNGQTYMLKIKDFRGSDDRKLREVLGMTVQRAWTEALLYRSMDAMAGLLWLFRIRTEPKLKFNDVLDSITLYVMDTLKDFEDAELEEMRAQFDEPGSLKVVDANPEAQGASS